MNRTALFLALSLAAAPVLAIDTTFTYQGTLTDAGVPANGSYDLQFTLLDNRQAVVGSAISLEDVALSNGVFTVVLDFGPTAFTGSDRFLQIGVRPGNATRTHTLLAPNTAIRPAPYSQLAADALFAASVDDNTITSPKIVDGAVGTADVADGAVATVDLAANAVTSAKIVDGTIVPADISPNSISSSLLAPGAVLNGNLAAGAVGTSQLLNNAVTSLKIADLSITDDDIAINTIAGQSILDGTIAAADIGADAVGSSEIANGSILANDIAANTIVGANILNGTITDTDIAAGTITGGSILNGTIAASDVATNTFWQAGGNAGTNPATHYFGTSDGAALRLQAGGGVGINIATPAAPFHVNAPSAGIGAGEVLARFGTASDESVSISRDSDATGTEIVFARGNRGGSIGFWGDLSSNLRLRAETGELSLGWIPGQTALDLRNTSAGSIAIAIKPGGGPWLSPSDGRLKHDVQPLQAALDRLLELRGVTFQYNDITSGTYPAGVQTGFVAQEVQRVFPSWVAKGADGFLLVGSKGFEALTVEALRELREEKDHELSAALEAIEALRQENVQMRAQLDALLSAREVSRTH